MYERTRIKICGLTQEAEVVAAIESGVDAVGFVFVKDSPRYIDPEDAANLVCMLPPLIMPIGLFVDTPPAQVTSMAMDACVEVVQLHGRESEADVQAVRSDFAIARGVQFGTELYEYWKTNPLIDLLIVDGSPGGEGTTFCWNALAQERACISRPMVLAGGLTPQNVGHGIRTLHPYAVDVSSGVECERGKKDPALIRSFCRAVTEANHLMVQQCDR